MTIGKFMRAAAAALSVATGLFALPLPAHAEWRRAESERFIVYGEGRAGDLTEFAQKLETFDRVLRSYMHLPVAEAPPRKLPIYVVRSHRGLETVKPDLGPQFAGYYIPTDEDIFAMAWRQNGNDSILLHEYAHHFMLQHFAFAYPAWFIEGFAEYFASADIRGHSVDVGKIDPGRAYPLLNARWLPLSDLLSKRPDQIDRRDETYYPLAGILTHWFFSDVQRRRQLSAYIEAVGAGADPVEAMQTATGLGLPELERELRSYIRRPLAYGRVPADFPDAQVTMTTLTASADALLLLNQRLKLTGEDEEDDALLEQVRAAAAPYGEDTFAMRVLAHAELDLGDRARAESLLDAVLAREPQNVEALQLLARARIAAADEADDLDAGDVLRRQARALLGRAYQVDDLNYTTLILLAESRRTAENYPNDNDIETLRLAFDLAPQLSGARFNLAATLIYAGRAREGVALLQPLLNDPHNPGAAAAARSMIEEAAAGRASRSVLDAAEAAEAIEEPTPPEPAADAPAPTP